MKPFFKIWKASKKLAQDLSNAKKRKVAELTRQQNEGGVESKLRSLGYLASNARLSTASMNEFIRLHRAELKKLDPDLYKAKQSGRAGALSYLHDVLVESSAEPEGGWKPFLPRITSGSDQGAA